MATPDYEPEREPGQEPDRYERDHGRDVARGEPGAADQPGAVAPPGADARPSRVRRGRRDARPRRSRPLIWVIAAGVLLAVGTAAGAKVLNPGLAALPPVIRDQSGHPAATGSGSADPATPTPAVTSAAPSVTPSQSPAATEPPAAPPPPPVRLSLEAESAESDGARVRRVPSASGGKVVALDREDEYVAFTVGVPAAGSYAVTFYYICGSGESRVAAVTVNSGRAAAVSFPPTGGWENVRPLTLRLDLVAGTNRIRFANTGAEAPNLDRITVVR